MASYASTALEMKLLANAAPTAQVKDLCADHVQQRLQTNRAIRRSRAMWPSGGGGGCWTWDLCKSNGPLGVVGFGMHGSIVKQQRRCFAGAAAR